METKDLDKLETELHMTQASLDFLFERYKDLKQLLINKGIFTEKELNDMFKERSSGKT